MDKCTAAPIYPHSSRGIRFVPLWHSHISNMASCKILIIRVLVESILCKCRIFQPCLMTTMYVSRGYLPTQLRMTSKPKKQRSWPSPWHMASRAGVQTAGGKTWHPRTYQWREWGYPIFTQTKGVYLWCTDVYGIWGTLCKYDLDAVWALSDWKSWMFHQYNGHVSNWYTACFTHGDWVCIPGCVCVQLSICYLFTGAAGFPFTLWSFNLAIENGHL